MNRKTDVPEKEKDRELSTAEKRRLERFTEVCERLEGEGYKKTELTVGIVKANIFAIAQAIPVYVLGYLLFFLRTEKGIGFNIIVFVAVYIILIVVHELIHGITWSIFCKNGFHDIEFGFMKEYLTPYCTCCTPLNKGSYIIGTLMPLIILGIIPTIIALGVDSFLLLNIGLLMIVSAGGDILIVWKLLTYRSRYRDILYYDHPTQAGGVIFER